MSTIQSDTTATVWKILVAVGDTVEEGDTVAVLESMKMEIPMEAEESGTVMAVHVAAGDAVSEGDVLVTLE